MDKKLVELEDVQGKPIFKPTLNKYLVGTRDIDIVEYLCRHVTMGGAVSDFCEVFKVDYFTLMKVIGENKTYKQSFNLAKSARKDYIKEKVTEELMNIASSKVTDAYESNGALKSIEDIPDNIKSLISSVKTSENETVEVKFQDKSKALDMLSKQQGMYVQKIEMKTEVTLESLLTESFKD